MEEYHNTEWTQRLLSKSTPFWKHRWDVHSDISNQFKNSCIGNWLYGIAKNFVYGLSIKAAIHFLLTLATKRNLRKAFSWIFTKDSFSFGLFIGLIPGIYKLSLWILRRIRWKDDSLNSIIAGIIWALSAFVDKNDGRRKLFIYFAFARSFESLLFIIDNTKIAKVPKNWGVMLYMLMTSVLVYMMNFDPDCVPRSVYKIIAEKGAMKHNDFVLIEQINHTIGRMAYS